MTERPLHVGRRVGDNERRTNRQRDRHRDKGRE